MKLTRMNAIGQIQAAMRLPGSSSRSSSQRAQAAVMPHSASGTCVISMSSCSLMLESACECVSSSAPPSAVISGKTSVAPERRDLGVGADEEEGGEAEEEQRPMPRPGRVAGALGEREQADGEHEEARPMVVVFRPGDVLGVARRYHALTGDKGLRPRRVGGGRGIELGLELGEGKAGMIRALEARPVRRQALSDLV